MSYPSKVHSGPELSPMPPAASAQHCEIGPCVPLTPKVDWRGTAQHIAIGRSPPPEQLQAPAVGWLARYLRGPLTKCARRLLRAMTQTCDAEQHAYKFAMPYPMRILVSSQQSYARLHALSQNARCTLPRVVPPGNLANYPSMNTRELYRIPPGWQTASGHVS